MFLAGKAGSTLEVAFFLFYSNLFYSSIEIKISLLCKFRPISRPNLDQCDDAFTDAL